MSCLFPTNEKIFIKRGSTLTINKVYLGDNGIPIPLTNKNLFSQVRNSALFLIQELTVTILDQLLYPGQYTLSAGIIADWPIDSLFCDVKIVDTIDNTVLFLPTFQIIVMEEITQE